MKWGSLLSYCLWQVLIVIILGFAAHTVSLTATELCHGIKATKDSRQMNALTVPVNVCLEKQGEEGMATHSRILAGESHGKRSLAGYSP